MFKVGDLVLYDGAPGLCMVLEDIGDIISDSLGQSVSQAASYDRTYRVMFLDDPHNPFYSYELEMVPATKENVAFKCKVWK